MTPSLLTGLLLAAAWNPAVFTAPSPDGTCPPLLTQRECRDLRARIEAAARPEQRERLKRHIEHLLQERARSCPCGSLRSAKNMPASVESTAPERRITM